MLVEVEGGGDHLVNARMTARGGFRIGQITPNPPGLKLSACNLLGYKYVRVGTTLKAAALKVAVAPASAASTVVAHASPEGGDESRVAAGPSRPMAPPAARRPAKKRARLPLLPPQVVVIDDDDDDDQPKAKRSRAEETGCAPSTTGSSHPPPPPPPPPPKRVNAFTCVRRMSTD
jgi:hypothetical protein